MKEILNQLNSIKISTELRRGLEKESLRVTPEGYISEKPHFESLGSALTHPHITTDYSEALLEFVTPVYSDPRAMLGYLKDPVGTEKALKNGWFYTGDVGVIHSDGYLEIKDRSKDIIITGGENVSSVEVETVLYTNPAVNEVAVVARPDVFWGETPCAFVSLKSGLTQRPTEVEMIEYCRKKMPKYMVPKTVSFVDELPKTSTGKVMKFVLREIAKKMGTTRLSRM